MKQIINRYALLMLISLITACTVSKDTPQPQVQLPATFTNTSSGSGSIAAMPWKDFFVDPVLRGLIDSAIVKNYDMQLAVKNIQASQLLVKQVKWNNVPEIGVNITANTNRASDNSLTGLSLSAFGVSTKHIEDYSANIGVSWEADIWGKIRNQSKSAVAAYLQTEEAKKAVQTGIVSAVAQGYYNLLMLHAQLAIASKNVALNDSTLAIIKLQFNAGQVTSLAVQQAQAQQLAAAGLIPQFEQNIALQEDALRILTGDLPAHIQVDNTLGNTPIAEGLSAGMPSEILSRRPDVKSQELALTIANAKVGINQANMYPALRLTASGGVNSFKASNWFSIPASLFGMAGASIFQPLLQHRELKTQYELAKVEREKTVIQFRQAVLNAVGEVTDALVKIDKLKAQEAIAYTRVNTLQAATGNAGLLFKNGMANYLEVITAQGNVLQSELELATIKRAELGAAADLYIALGGGWK